jgi:predicted Zn finger-like uncharacterized protein
MSHLLTQCPFCQTSFKVNEEQMQAANGVVRCGSCMEVFLADQHRIVLKDNASLPEEQILESSPDFHQEKSEPVIDAYQPTPLFDDTEDQEDQDDQEEETQEIGESQPVDNDSSDPLSKDNIDNILNDIDSALDDAFFDDFDNDLKNDSDSDNNSDSDDDIEDEQVGESDVDSDIESDDGIDNEKPEQDIAETQEENSTLIFSPWDDLVTIQEDSTPNDSEEHDAWQEAAQESNEDSDTDEAEKPFFMPWQDETTPPGEVEEAEDHPDNEIADNDSADTEANSEKEQTDTETPEPLEQAAPGNYSAFLNPSGYSKRPISFDQLLPGQNPVDSTNPTPATNADPFDAQEEDALAVDDSEQTSVFTIDQEEPDTTTENTFLGASTKSDIPTLVPDVVATETIPVSMNTRAMAWFQSLRNTLTRQDDNHGEYSASDNKAMIRSHLANLNNEDSLEPVDDEKLDAIEEAPVELVTISDPLKHWKVAGMVLACLVLLGTLAGQYLIYNLDSLVNDGRFDAVTSLTCQVAECQDNTLIDLSNLITEELVVRSHPSANNALMVDFIFRNESSSEQLFPLVELNFTNISGEIIANRVFDRTEYLPPEMQLFTHMPAHSSIQVSLELADPGDDASGYALVFRNP